LLFDNGGLPESVRAAPFAICCRAASRLRFSVDGVLLNTFLPVTSRLCALGLRARFVVLDQCAVMAECQPMVQTEARSEIVGISEGRLIAICRECSSTQSSFFFPRAVISGAVVFSRSADEKVPAPCLSCCRGSGFLTCGLMLRSESVIRRLLGRWSLSLSYWDFRGEIWRQLHRTTRSVVRQSSHEI